MRKRVRVCDPRVEVHNADDFISRLPYEVIISIVSCLKLKEAGATSILSTQWRNLWKSVTSLDFNTEPALDETVLDSKTLNTERAKYINWVNRVIRQHNGLALDAFKICFDLDKTSKSAIDNWVKFAVSKNVKRLELKLMEYGNGIRETKRNYTFPFKLFTGRHSHSHMATLTGLRFLRVLTLRRVNVSDQVVEFLLSNCPLLEFLSVRGSGDMVNVKVTGQTLKLNSLEIAFCLGLKTIEIQDTNLVSFFYLGPRVTFIFKNVPKLERLSVGMCHSGIENNVFGQLACCFNHLETLTLLIYRPQQNMNLSNTPELLKLKKLVLKIGAWNDECLLEFTSLLKVSPNLERFVLKLIWLSPLKTRKKMLQGERFLHQSLKVVEIYGYFGRVSDAEMALYFIRNAPALQKIVIDPHDQILDRSSLTEEQAQIEESARIHAHQHLQLRVPPNVELVIKGS